MRMFENTLLVNVRNRLHRMDMIIVFKTNSMASINFRVTMARVERSVTPSLKEKHF